MVDGDGDCFFWRKTYWRLWFDRKHQTQLPLLATLLEETPKQNCHSKQQRPPPPEREGEAAKVQPSQKFCVCSSSLFADIVEEWRLWYDGDVIVMMLTMILWGLVVCTAYYAYCAYYALHTMQVCKRQLPGETGCDPHSTIILIIIIISRAITNTT